jgi:hypothetical protein
MQALQVVAALQAAQPVGQGRQEVLTVGVQGAARYCPAPHEVQALQTTPSPVKPGWQAQVKLPSVFTQLALAEQLAVAMTHSLMSAHPEAPPPL